MRSSFSFDHPLIGILIDWQMYGTRSRSPFPDVAMLSDPGTTFRLSIDPDPCTHSIRPAFLTSACLPPASLNICICQKRLILPSAVVFMHLAAFTCHALLPLVPLSHVCDPQYLYPPALRYCAPSLLLTSSSGFSASNLTFSLFDFLLPCMSTWLLPSTCFFGPTQPPIHSFSLTSLFFMMCGDNITW